MFVAPDMVKTSLNNFVYLNWVTHKKKIDFIRMIGQWLGCDVILGIELIMSTVSQRAAAMRCEARL